MPKKIIYTLRVFRGERLALLAFFVNGVFVSNIYLCRTIGRKVAPALFKGLRYNQSRMFLVRQTKNGIRLDVLRLKK